MTRVLLLVVTGLAAAGAGALLLSRAPGRLDRGRPELGRSRPGRRSQSPVLPAVGLTGVGIGVAVAAGLEGHHLALLAVGLAAALGVLRIRERARADRVAQQRRQLVVDYCEALVGELRAGQPTARAVERSVAVWADADAVAAAVRLDASVPGALRRLARLPGAAALRRLAGAWEISASTGSGLVLAVEQVLASVRAEEATARLVRAELASARATARLVTALPVVVLLAAQGIGARPWHFLLDTPAGVACLAAGVSLAFTGLSWIDRIAARSVEGGS